MSLGETERSALERFLSNSNSETENVENTNNVEAVSETNTTPPGVESISPEDAVPEGIHETGQEIGPNQEQLAEDTETEQTGYSLGDHVLVRSEPYGDVRGVVWYISPSLFRVKSDDSNKVFDFPLQEDGSWAPELQMVEEPQLETDNALFLIEEGRRPAPSSILELLNLRSTNLIDIFAPDGTKQGTYTIVDVNEEDSRIRIQDDTGGELELDLTEPYGAIRVRERPSQPEKPVSAEEEQRSEEEVALQQATSGESVSMLTQNSNEVLSVLSLGEVELDEIAIAREISEAEKIVDELTQKSDLLRDLLSMFDETQQKNPATLRRVRDLVEMCSALKNSIIERDQAGVPIGEVSVSISTLSDLFKNRTTPLVRPILNTNRVLLNDEPSTQHTVLEDENITIEPQYGIQEDSDDFLTTLGNLPAEGTGNYRWVQVLNQYFDRYPLGDTFPGGSFTFTQDGDFFRGFPPTLEPSGTTESVVGLPKLLDAVKLSPAKFEKAQFAFEPLLKGLSMSLRRGVGPTYGLQERSVQVLRPGDSAEPRGYVLFPYRSIQEGLVGATRSGNLFETVLRSLPPVTTMTGLVKTFGEGALAGTSEIKDIQKLLVFSVTNPTDTQLRFTDYLSQVLKLLNPRGEGDIHVLQAHLGIQDKEFTLEQQGAITKRVTQVRQAVREYITGLRTTLEKGRSPAKKENLLGAEATNRISAAIKGLTELEDLEKQIAQRTPAYSKIDIALFAYLLRYAQEYLLAALGGDARRITRERERFVRDMLLQQYANERDLQNLLSSAGQPPDVNPCQHVKELEQIRAIQDIPERMGLLNQFLRQYKGEVNGNWFECLVCKNHLLCRHEILQVQQFLHPRERNELQKEIVLGFAGGLFGENYICKQCGKPIAELGYDTHMEYDDEGRPMAGREELVDQDAAEDEEIEAAFGVPIIPEDREEKFDNDTMVQLYKIAKTICDAMYVRVTDDQMRTLVERAAASLPTFQYTEKVYQKWRRTQKLDVEYDEYQALYTVALVASHVLVTIQTTIPELAPRRMIPSCKTVGFSGFPLNPDAKPSSEEESPGLSYILCGTKSIVKRLRPWILFAKTLAQRKKGLDLYEFLLQFTIKKVAQDPSIQDDLHTKRDYLEKQFGKDALFERASLERIPQNFLPRMRTRQEAKEDSAKNPVIAEGARGQVAEGLVADAWIRAANEKAVPTALIIRGNPFAETACCFDPVTRPGAFFKDAGLPGMPKFRVPQWPHKRQSLLYTPILPRPLEGFNASPSLDVAFRVFLKLCYKGVRVGLPHQLGPDNVCDWCEIRIPTEVLVPDVNKDGDPILDEQKVQVELEAQGIPINAESFQALLDAANQKHSFTPYVPPKLTPVAALWKRIAQLDPPPFEAQGELEENNVEEPESFGNIIVSIFVSLKKLPPTAADVERAVKLAPLGDAIQPFQQTLVQVLDMGVSPSTPGKTFTKTLLQFIRQGQSIVFEGLRSYFLAPAEMLLSRKSDSLPGRTLDDIRQEEGKEKTPTTMVPKRFKFGKEHTERLQKQLLDHYLTVSDSLYPIGHEDKLEKARVKLQYFVEQLSEISKISEEFSAARLSYESVPKAAIQDFLNQLLRAFVLGPLAQLVDSSFVPPLDSDASISTSQGHSDTFLVTFVKKAIVKLREEFIAYSPTAVREYIEKTAEREKQNIIALFDTLTVEERQIELQKKTLKIGRWALGSKLKTYDPEVLEQLRQTLNYDRLQGAEPDGRDGAAFVRADEPFDRRGFLAADRGRSSEDGYEIRFHSEDIDE
jgi:hypothetical protein